MDKMKVTLSSNIEWVKANKLDAKSNVITVVVSLEDYENGVENPIFYAERYGMFYNPNDNFNPDVKGGNALGEKHIDFYMDQISEARKEYKRRLQDRTTNSGGASSAELDELKETIRQKEARIREQATKIAQLSTNGGNGGNAQTDRLEALIEMQTGVINQLNLLKPKTIRIKIGEKNNEMKETILHNEFETILSYIANGVHVYMYGPAGTGKSTIGEKVAEALNRKFIPESALRDDIKITGYKDSNGVYHESSFYIAMKEGCLYMIDEIDNSHPDVLTVINTAIAQGYFIFPNGELVRAQKGFMVIVAGNTTGDGGDGMYIRNVIDGASSDRFIQIEINYDIEVEKAITNNNMELIEFCHEYRKAIEMTDGVNSLFSYRGLSHISKMENIVPLEKLLKHALVKGIAPDDMRMIARNINVPSTNKYLKALKQAV